MTDDFTGFPIEGLDFLTELATKDKAWFANHRKTYTELVVAPTKAFVVALGERLSDEISPTIVAEPKTNGSISPINNDLRFAKDKSPYKDHLLLRFWDGPDKRTAPMLMVRISASEIGFSSGAAITSVEAWRRLVHDEIVGSELVSAVDKLEGQPRIDIGGEQLKRVPKPYPEDHARADLLRRKGSFHVRWPEPSPPEIHTAGLVDYCMQRLHLCQPLHAWFLKHPLHHSTPED